VTDVQQVEAAVGKSNGSSGAPVGVHEI